MYLSRKERFPGYAFPGTVLRNYHWNTLFIYISICLVTMRKTHFSGNKIYSFGKLNHKMAKDLKSGPVNMAFYVF